MPLPQRRGVTCYSSVFPEVHSVSSGHSVAPGGQLRSVWWEDRQGSGTGNHSHTESSTREDTTCPLDRWKLALGRRATQRSVTSQRGHTRTEGGHCGAGRDRQQAGASQADRQEAGRQNLRQAVTEAQGATGRH